MSTYESFVERFSHIQLLRQTKRLLSWDQQTYMPAGAVDIRAKQLAYLASLAHGEATSSKYRDALAEMIDIDTEEIKLEGLSKIEASNLKQWCKDFKGTTKLPQSFVQAYYATTTTATEVWKKARATSDFDLFRPWLQKVVNLNREKANLLGYVDSPYDALIDLYEPGITSSTLSTLFEDLSSFLSAIVKKQMEKIVPIRYVLTIVFTKKHKCGSTICS